MVEGFWASGFGLSCFGPPAPAEKKPERFGKQLRVRSFAGPPGLVVDNRRLRA